MIEGLPVTCQLCGEHYPDNDALWDHECPEWQRVVRNSRPRLAVYRNIDTWYKSFDSDESAGFWRKMVDWGIGQSRPDLEEPELMDALEKLGVPFSRKLERKLQKRGLIIEIGDKDESDTGWWRRERRRRRNR